MRGDSTATKATGQETCDAKRGPHFCVLWLVLHSKCVGGDGSVVGLATESDALRVTPPKRPRKKNKTHNNKKQRDDGIIHPSAYFFGGASLSSRPDGHSPR